MADRIAVPFEHAEEVQEDVGVRITVPLHEPRRGAAHGETQLFGELAVERFPRGLAGLELAAGKFPVARVGLAGGALREQHLPVRAQDDGRRDVQEDVAHAPLLLTRRVFCAIAAAPA